MVTSSRSLLLKKNKKKSVLSRQKPRKSRKKSSLVSGSFLKWIFIGVLIIGIFWVAFIGSERALHAFHSSFGKESPRKDWHISLKLHGETALEPELAEDVLEMAFEKLGNGSGDDLKEAAQYIQNEASFESVRVIRTSQKQVTISIKRRDGVMCVLADRLRLMTTTGSVYGRVNPKDCPGPVVSGVFSDRDRESKFRLNTDMTIKLRTEERLALNQSVHLNQAIKLPGYKVKKIHFQKYRGFSIFILDQKGADNAPKDAEFEVFLGSPPFENSLKRLDKILGKLKARGQVAKRIELDYQGKAFIKLRTPKKG